MKQSIKGVFSALWSQYCDLVASNETKATSVKSVHKFELIMIMHYKTPQPAPSFILLFFSCYIISKSIYELSFIFF